MGTLLDDDLYGRLYNNIFIFDLEYIGTSTNLNTCHIWEIGMVHWTTGASFSITIRPDIYPYPPPFSKDFIQLTSAILTDRQAVDFNAAWNKVLHWMHTLVIHTANVVLVAHNSFKADKPMLEIDTKRHGVTIPYNWYFLDSLMYCRKMIPKLQSYTLGDIYTSLFDTDIEDAHQALPDAVALRNILIKVNACITGPIYPSYSTPLQVVKWLGPSCEGVLFQHNILSLQQLILAIMTSYSTTCLSGSIPPIRYFVERYLVTQFGINQGNSTSIADSLVNRWLPGTV